MQTEFFPSQPSTLGSFVLGQSTLGYANTGMFQQVIPAYLYEQYNDDADLLAFVNAYNTLAQGYVDWFNNTPLALYTSANVTGALLDWAATGIYGIPRPVISSLTTKTAGALNSLPMNTASLNKHTIRRGGNAQPASDDIYKRVLTWILYKNDGIQPSLQWLRRRVARFLYGANGSDVSLDEVLNVSIVQPTILAVGSMATVPMNTRAMNTRVARSQKAARTLDIQIPASPIATQFASLLTQGYLPAPFQVSYRVSLT